MRDALLYKSQMHFRGGDTFTRLVSDRPSFSLLLLAIACMCACMCMFVCCVEEVSHIQQNEKNATRFFPKRARRQRAVRVSWRLTI